MAISDGLKPCPFCGGNNIKEAVLSGGDWHKCEDCYAQSGGLEDWNVRPIEDALQKRIAELEAQLRVANERSQKNRCRHDKS